MTTYAYVNGRYVPAAHAAVSAEDRGYQFADGIYEVIAFYNQRLLDGDLHFARLERSLDELRIAPPVALNVLPLIVQELIAKNGLPHGTVYIQITRGAGRRDHAFPKTSIKPVLSLFTTGPKWPKEREITEGAAVITHPDQRWSRRDIKSIALLPNILAKQKAVEAGVREAWLYEADGSVTEGSSTNAWMVDGKGTLITHPANEHILWGVTRAAALKLAREAQMAVEERVFTLEELSRASEAFLTSTTSNVLPIVTIDGKPVGNGKPGEKTKRLLELFHRHIEQETGYVWPSV